MRTLFLDIETAPNLVTVWGLWNQNVAINQILDSGYTLCWSAKWRGEDDILFDSQYRNGTKKMLKNVHKLLDEADAVVHYNGTKFDIPTLNKEFLLNDLSPPAPYKQIDLLRTARGQFRFPSNKLDYICQELGLGNKIKHRGHELWLGCMNGDPQSWQEMEEYNVQDVVLLEKLYNRLVPWIKSHPNYNLYTEGTCCPNCGSKHFQKRGYYHSNVSTFQRYKCKKCGAWFRSRKNEAQQDRFAGIP
jgi:rubredoxin